jgi:hypothetical protein
VSREWAEREREVKDRDERLTWGVTRAGSWDEVWNKSPEDGFIKLGKRPEPFEVKEVREGRVEDIISEGKELLWWSDVEGEEMKSLPSEGETFPLTLFLPPALPPPPGGPPSSSESGLRLRLRVETTVVWVVVVVVVVALVSTSSSSSSSKKGICLDSIISTDALVDEPPVLKRSRYRLADRSVSTVVGDCFVWIKSEGPGEDKEARERAWVWNFLEWDERESFKELSKGSTPLKERHLDFDVCKRSRPKGDHSLCESKWGIERRELNLGVSPPVEKQTIGVSKADGDKILSAKFAKSDFGVCGDSEFCWNLVLFGVRFPVTRIIKINIATLILISTFIFIFFVFDRCGISTWAI